MSSPSTRRILKEAAELTTSPSPHFHASPSPSNLYDWHFTLAGPPPPSPYSQGIYHGRIVLPPTYPLRPPSFRFLTPSGRFEVNREICLSISGHHEESWQPAWGIRTALVALRSFMDAEAGGQVGGLVVGREERERMAGESRRWVCRNGDAEGACSGRSNETVLSEWREYCVSRGVVDSEEGKKEEKDALGDGDAQTTTTTTHSASAESPRAPPAPASTSPSPSPPPPPAQTQPQTQQAPPTAQTTSTSSQPQPQPQPLHPPRRTLAPTPPQSPTSSTPWLDRAIFGVFVALVLMILRRFVSYED